MDIKSSTIEKFIDSIGKIFGYVLEPTQRKRIARAELQIREMNFQAELSEKSRIAEINKTIGEQSVKLLTDAVLNPIVDKANVKDGILDITSEGNRLMSLIEDPVKIQAFQRFLNRAKFKQKNLTSTIELISEEINFSEEVDEKQMDSNWINKWVDHVENVTEKDVQRIWAKIFAGEFRKKGTISPRTMTTLNNLSKAEADLFFRISPLVFAYPDQENDDEEEFNIPFLFNFRGSDLLGKYGLRSYYRGILVDCGLVQPGEGKLASPEFYRNQSWSLLGSKRAIFLSFNEKFSKIMYTYYLTKAGGDLWKTLSFDALPLEYLISMKRELGNSIDFFKYCDLPEGSPTIDRKQNWIDL